MDDGLLNSIDWDGTLGMLFIKLFGDLLVICTHQVQKN